MGITFRFPAEPDWPWLLATFPGNVLLHPDWSVVDIAQSVHGRIAYLATPYTREVLNDDFQFDRALSLQVEIRTARWARTFALLGATTISPILQACAMCSADVEGHLDPLDDPFWAGFCQPLLTASAAVIVPPMPGWDRSRGVWREACDALRHNVPVYLVRPGSELGVST